jgi:hypothetical protein
MKGPIALFLMLFGLQFFLHGVTGLFYVFLIYLFMVNIELLMHIITTVWLISVHAADTLHYDYSASTEVHWSSIDIFIICMQGQKLILY